jgi:hypothetical protein
MTVEITVHITDQPDQRFSIDPGALDAVRFDFNPSGQRDVVVVKALSAALLTLCDGKSGSGTGPARMADPRGRWMAIARTHIETAQMFAVKAVTYTP